MVLAAGVIALYLLAAYFVVPLAWKRYAHRHPSLDDVPGITQTAAGIPGDPLNVALIGTESEVKAIMAAAKWYPADPLGLKSDFHKVRKGKNGGGDPWETDGRLFGGIVMPGK